MARDRSVLARKLASPYSAGSYGTRRPILVATVIGSPGLAARNCPIRRSLRPSPYTSAVSRNVTPACTAASSTASASASATSPQSAPSCQVPRPTTETARPVRPRMRSSTGNDLTAAARRAGRLACRVRILAVVPAWTASPSGCKLARQGGNGGLDGRLREGIPAEPDRPRGLLGCSGTGNRLVPGTGRHSRRLEPAVLPVVQRRGHEYVLQRPGPARCRRAR